MKKTEYIELFARAEAELRIRLGLDLSSKIDTAVVLGTGWGDQFEADVLKSVRLSDLEAFRELDELGGHARQIELVEIETTDQDNRVQKKRILILRGRVHMNEDTFNPAVRLRVRMQVELLFHLGVKRLILTCSAGALSDELTDGDVVVINGLPSFGNEVMPLFPGEFKSPEAALDPEWIQYSSSIKLAKNVPFMLGSYMFYRGPHFESTADKERMLAEGAICVGMSTKPECTVAALYDDVKVIALGFVSNDNKEEPDHELHKRRAKKHAERLAQALKYAINF